MNSSLALRAPSSRLSILNFNLFGGHGALGITRRARTWVTSVHLFPRRTKFAILCRFGCRQAESISRLPPAAAFKFRILRIFEVLINEHPINKSFFKLMLNKQPLIEGLLKKRSDFCRPIIFILCCRQYKSFKYSYLIIFQKLFPAHLRAVSEMA